MTDDLPTPRSMLASGINGMRCANELLTGVDGVSTRAVRRIVLRVG
jgi:hypothetical protein